MPIHTLFVCEACGAPNHEEASESAEGNQLLQQLLAQYSERDAQADLRIQPAGCLWTCDRPCSIALMCPQKFTYQFVDLLLEGSAADLMELCRLYMDSEDGYILPANLPRSLRSKLLVRIPPPEAARP